MRQTARLVLVISLLIVSITFLSKKAGADFNSAVIAYDRGKFHSARKDFIALAEMGHAGAEFMLGVMRFYGRGVPANDALAAIWFYKSAIKGNPTGQLALGALHIRGLGVRQNLVKAYGWLSVVANQATPRLRKEAIAIRNKTAKLMKPEEISDGHKWANRFKARPAGLIRKE